MDFLECETFFLGTASRIPSHNEPRLRPEDSVDADGVGDCGDAVASAGVYDVEEEEEEGERSEGSCMRSRVLLPHRNESVVAVRAGVVHMMRY